MANTTAVLFPKMQQILSEVGDNIRLARLRRRLSSEQVAERAGISRSTLVKIEQGHPGVGIGHFLNVMRVLGLASDFLLLAKDDVFGRKLQDLQIETKKRAPKRDNE